MNVTMINEIQKRLDAQKSDIENFEGLTAEDIEAIVFTESDVVESYLRENNISEDDVNLEALRDMQRAMIQSLEVQ